VGTATPFRPDTFGGFAKRARKFDLAAGQLDAALWRPKFWYVIYFQLVTETDLSFGRVIICLKHY
jgi:hypothetical protein